jgi:hypothetical protein
MGVILSCKSSQCHQCRTSGEERTGSGKGIGFPPHFSNRKENLDDLKSKTRFAASGTQNNDAGSIYRKSFRSRTDVELPKRNGLPNMGARSGSGERKRSSFLSDLFFPRENISRDGNLKFMPFNQGEPKVLQPTNFFLVHSSMVEKRSHPSPSDLNYYCPTTILESDLKRPSIGKNAFSDSTIRKSPTPNGKNIFPCVERGKILLNSTSLFFSMMK